MSLGNVFVINEMVLGNALLALPYLVALTECSRGTVHYPDNAFLSSFPFIEQQRLKTFPARWFTLEARDLPDILAYIHRSSIETVICLRNEFKLRPPAESEVREALCSRGIDQWWVDDVVSECRHEYIVTQWQAMFARHGNPLQPGQTPDQVTRTVLAEVIGVPRRSDLLGLYLGGSRFDKRVASHVWGSVANLLVEQWSGIVQVFAGPTAAEIAEAQAVQQLVRSSRVAFRTARELTGLIRELAEMRGLISNDTFAMHLGYAMGIPTVGLFSTTRRAVWGPPDSAHFRGISSSVCARCTEMPVQGSCWFQPEVCPQVPRQSFVPREVAQALLKLLK